MRATPAVRQLARELGVELVGLGGSGPGGRIVEDDVRAAASATATATDGRRVPVRGIRRAIVEQVTRTHREVPAVTFVEECDFTGADLALLVPLAIHAVGRRARRGSPSSTLAWRATTSCSSTGWTSASPCRQTTGWSSPSSAAASSAPSRRSPSRCDGSRTARATGSLTAEELRDSTFTVTSAGKLGGLFVTPLVNHPEVAILGLHRIADRAVVRDGQVVVRKVGNVSVSFDHRVVDGARAAGFCLDVIERLQSAAVQPT